MAERMNLVKLILDCFWKRYRVRRRLVCCQIKVLIRAVVYIAQQEGHSNFEVIEPDYMMTELVEAVVYIV